MFALKIVRKSRGVSQKFLAEKLGVSNNAVSMWETGKREPCFAFVVALSELLNCTTDELLKPEKAMNENRKEES